MSCASQIVGHSKKVVFRNKSTPLFDPNARYILRNVPQLLQYEKTILARRFSNDVHTYIGKRDDIMKVRRHGYTSVERQKGFSTDVNGTAAPLGSLEKTVSRGTMVLGNEMARPLSNVAFSCTQAHLIRGFSSNSGLPPHQEIGMPSLSPTMTEGNIAKWMKKEGEKVSPGEVLCEVETDKATVEMECMEEGYLAKIIKGDGSKDIKVGEVIAITVEEEEDIPKFKDYSPSASDASTSTTEEPSTPSPKKEAVEEPIHSQEPKISQASPTPAGDHIFASPLARKMAEEHNVSLSSIRGTGPDGSIVKGDIEDYLASSGKEAPATMPRATDATAAALDYVDIPHSQIRKITASRLLFSKQSIPHYYLTVDTCVDKLMDLRGQLNALQEASGGKRISINDLVIKAAAMALRRVPHCNSSWTDDFIRQYKKVNVNVAIQTDNGLYVPVIRDADRKGLSTIAEEVKLLAKKAKENSLKPEDYEGGTFTVSNLGGPFGIKQFCAIINPPQSGILAVGSAEKRVIPGSGPDQFNFASFMSVTLSCDHRVIDGAIGAEWLKAFKGFIENPESMLL